MPFALTSSTFTDGASVPRAHTCEGDDTSPPLTWSDPPAGTATFALVVDDPDAPGGVFTHWMLADIPATIGTLPAGATAGVAGTNGFSITLANPLQAPGGVGVTQANLTVTGGSGYIGAPAVVFSAKSIFNPYKKTVDERRPCMRQNEPVQPLLRVMVYK